MENSFLDNLCNITKSAFFQRIEERTSGTDKFAYCWRITMGSRNINGKTAVQFQNK